jgi:hypothetical protein
LKVFSTAFFRNWASAYESERAGAGRGVFFVNYLRSLVRNHWAVWPDYQLWIYHDDRAREFPYWKSLNAMADRGLLRLFYMGESKRLCESMLWRMIPCWNVDVETVLCRDLDALSTPRERKAVEKWLASGRAVSALHDSESHSSAALMGGMVSFRASWIRDHWESYNTLIWKAGQYAIDLSRHGSDQQLLNAEVLPIALDEQQLISEDRQSMGAKDHPIDQLISHAGGAFHVDPCVEWFKANRDYCPRLSEIEECEKA